MPRRFHRFKELIEKGLLGTSPKANPYDDPFYAGSPCFALVRWDDDKPVRVKIYIPAEWGAAVNAADELHAEGRRAEIYLDKKLIYTGGEARPSRDNSNWPTSVTKLAGLAIDEGAQTRKTGIFKRRR